MKDLKHSELILAWQDADEFESEQTLIEMTRKLNLYDGLDSALV